MKKNKKPQYIDGVKIEKMVFGGQGIAHKDGQTVFVWNALPGEVVKLKVLKKRKGIIEGVAQEIVNPSKDRIQPIDDHYLSSAPWQMMKFEAEQKYKIEIAKETLSKIGRLKIKDLNISSDNKVEGYRNKMEFGFFESDDKQLYLSLFNRGSRYPRPVKACSIAQKELMDTAFQVLQVLKDNNVSRWDLKTMIIRSNRAGENLVGLFVTNEGFDKDGVVLNDLRELCFGKLLGVHIFYSILKSPASVVTKELGGVGQDYITEQLFDSTLQYGIHSFFQVNPNIFEMTLNKINSHLNGGDDVLDFYSGVGSITIPLNERVHSSILVDSNEEAISFSLKNIRNEGLKDFDAKVSEAEKIVEEITKDKVLILDPPRAGLHKNVIEKILEVKPEKVIYLSCNISTQARDLKMLSKEYDIIDAELYNYFPRTPHFESLVVLKKNIGILNKLKKIPKLGFIK